MEKKSRLSPPAIGGSSLLVIFAVLCLTVFCLLGLSTVQAEKRLADASAQAVVDYYEADSAAEMIFARIRNGELPQGVIKNGNVYEYQCQISQTQTLEVKLKWENKEWIVLRWQAVAKPPVGNNNGPSVWDGEA